ncbi:peptidoglycan bridge formation glycyltransferase FemA/FemB family protein [Auritidibacter ignavus]|uniref:lipid II:glycine glycyltransferase FemX n=1 Tax=Auritidibacter ignavus TaxID=678932 RepID=UPI002446CBA2|nr:peptidoglycan bridge formation glycyltransferase FemA/FemB family protein [Auritidibacter ignavus]WGH90743.1 peptidoglycan bridge formation glycyltransferase FemA/FemB family protein [Auritidibacter ignavus]WHS35427.1 peptidoglycan bridge formation glycyltransferase FemA/FemB family protein [Auritidibacter ignavus]
MTSRQDLRITDISTSTHEQFLASQPSASFLQNPRWPQVKTGWRGQSLGWYRGDELVAASLVLYRGIPAPLLRTKSLAYLADGPVFSADTVALGDILEPLVPYLRSQGAFLIRMGLPFSERSWSAHTVRSTLSKGDETLVTELDADSENDQVVEMTRLLDDQGWSRPKITADFQAGQAQFQARIPLPELSEAERNDRESEGFQEAVEQVLSRMDSTSRRQTRKSTRSELKITATGAEALDRWQQLFEETAERDGFSGRPQEYFERMATALGESEVSDFKVLLAEYEDQLLASAIYVQQRDTGWYVYGASSRAESKRYAPRALQLEQIKLSLEAGCRWYDLGGISPTLDKEHPLAGLSRFKTTMGADVHQTMGEWDLSLNKLLANGFNFYMNRRG